MNVPSGTGGGSLRAALVPALLATGLGIVLLYVLPGGTTARVVLMGLALVLAPAAAFAAGVLAMRGLAGPMGRPWALIAAAGAAGVLGQVHLYAGPAATHESVHALLTVAAMALFALGVGWIVHQRDREPVLEIGLDAALVVGAVTVVTLRWSPAAQAILADPAAFSLAYDIGIFGAPIAAGCAFLFASVLLLVRGHSATGLTAPAIAAASVAFGAGVAPLALGRGECCTAGSWSGVAYGLGWLCVAFAALRTGAVGARAFAPVGADAGGSRVRLVVAPAVALVLGAVVVDSSLGLPLQQATAIALGLLGVLLAVRVSQVLYATRRQTAERLELAQSRALIEVSQALSGTRELDEILDLVTHWAVQLLNAKGAAIELLSKDGTLLELRAVQGLPEEVLHLRFPVSGSFTGWVVQHGRARATPDAARDALLHPASGPYLAGSAIAAAPLRYRDVTFGALSCVGRFPFTDADLELLGAFADQAAVAIENARLFRQVHQLSMTDPLTGLANRRQLDRDLTREFAAARRGRQLVAVMFDLNGFKQFNDRHGHLAGDDALRLFAAALATETRAMNMAARYGGDEFVVLLADADARGTEVFIERVRERFPGDDADDRMKGLGVAAGYALYHHAMQRPEDLLAAADAALYQDKPERSARM